MRVEGAREALLMRGRWAVERDSDVYGRRVNGRSRLSGRFEQIKPVTVAVEARFKQRGRRQFFPRLKLDEAAGVEAAEVNLNLLETTLEVQNHEHAFGPVRSRAHERIEFVVRIGRDGTSAAHLL